MNRGRVIFLATLLVFGVTLNAVWATDHTASFLDLDYAIWANHAFALGRVGQFVPNSVDIFQYRGQYFSALAPGLALLALPFVALGFIIEGHFSEYGAVMLFSELFVAVLNALAALYLYKLSRMYFSEATASFIALAYAFSTVGWPFATFFFQSDASAALDVIAVYFVLRATRGSGGSAAILLGGLSVAAAMTVDYVNFLLMPVLLVYTVASLRRDRRPLAKVAAGFALCSFLGVLTIGLYNYASFGQVLVSSEQLFLHSSSVLGEFSTPLYLGAVLNLFTPLRGIFLYSPILLVGVFGFRKMLGASAVRREGLLILAVFTALFLPYCAWYGPTGGLSFGPRFIVASLPFLLLPAGYVIEGGWRYRGPVVYVLYSAGVVVNGLAALTSALAGNTGWLASPFLDSTVPLLARGTLDQWWTRFLGGFWPAAAGTVIAAALLLPDILGRASEQGPGLAISRQESISARTVSKSDLKPRTLTTTCSRLSLQTAQPCSNCNPRSSNTRGCVSNRTRNFPFQSPQSLHLFGRRKRVTPMLSWTTSQSANIPPSSDSSWLVDYRTGFQHISPNFRLQCCLREGWTNLSLPRRFGNRSVQA